MNVTKHAALIAALACQGQLAVGDPTTSQFDLPAAAEIVARITARCDACAWDAEGREAVTLSISLDDRYVAHLPLVRQGRAEYPVLLGAAAAGRHTVRVQIDAETTSRELRRGTVADVENIQVIPVPDGHAEHTALSLAPFLHARPNTLGRFTDLPVFMWYEREPTPRGTRYRYSVIFTNEDGGTPTDRLMATWGRTTDIEYVYSVEVDATGKILVEDFQGPDHEVLPFRGTREGRHPLLWVSTDNNMMRDSGATRVRYAPAPVAFALDGVSREAVMDAHPWLYVVASQELAREHKIVENVPPGQSTIPDPRRFVYIEACGEVGNAALAFEVGVRDAWVSSDRGMSQYRIARDGCFRAAVPVSAGITSKDLRAIRVLVYARPPGAGEPGLPPEPVRLDRINTVFMLDERHEPGRPLLRWTGPTPISDAAPLEIPIRNPMKFEVKGSRF